MTPAFERKHVRFSFELAAAHRLGGRSLSAFSSYLATRGTQCSATIRMIKRVNQDGKFLAGRILELSRRN